MFRIFEGSRSIHSFGMASLLLILVTCGCAGPWQARRAPAPVENDPIEDQQLVASFERARTQAEFQAAHDQIELGNLAVAEENLKTLLRRLPKHRAARLLLAELYATTDRPADALPLLNQTIEDNPASAAAHHLRGMVLHDLNRTVDAMQSLTRAVELEPSNALYRASFEMMIDGE